MLLAAKGFERELMELRPAHPLKTCGRIGQPERSPEAGLGRLDPDFLPLLVEERDGALESASQNGTVEAASGDTRLLIQPGHRFHSADILFTNFHLPRSTLLALVCAFGGIDRVLAAYKVAIELGYRFYSYGDAMLLERAS